MTGAIGLALLVVTLVSTAMTAWGTYLAMIVVPRLQRDLNEQTTRSHKLQEDLTAQQASYKHARGYISSMEQACDLALPVLLIGPRNAGKSSLMRAWLAPWSDQDHLPTSEILVAQIPLGVSVATAPGTVDFDKTIRIPRRYALALRVVDVPGDLKLQQPALGIWRKEVDRFRSERRNVQMSADGAVVIVFFNLGDVFEGNLLADYYTGEFFHRLTEGVSRVPGASVHRIIVVLNHSDRLPKTLVNASHSKIIEQTKKKLGEVIKRIQGAVSSQNLFFVVSMLQPKNDAFKGSDQIKALVAGEFVEFFSDDMDPHSATFGLPYDE